MTCAAAAAIDSADVIVGYHAYLELISEQIKGKTVVGSGMMQEVERCEAAVKLAEAGKQVAVVSSGDPGIYGMAGLVLELVLKLDAGKRPAIRVVPGVSAVGAAAAVLGAPLMHDFAVISLSDLLTPWDLIEKRVLAAAQADFVISLYNPKSTRRTSQIEKVREILLQYRDAKTPVGIVRNATRADEEVVISSLEHFTKEKIDMFTVIIIGNSQTFSRDGFIVTPRGYRL
jgi:precorrin-3B C17-methyltransferase